MEAFVPTEELKNIVMCIQWGFPGGSVGKKTHLPMRETQEMPVGSLGWEDALENEMAVHFSILAWRIPRTEESARL